MVPDRPGYIRAPADSELRPLTQAEADAVFAATVIMLVKTAPAYGIHQVVEVGRADGDARLTFEDGGSARLSSSHPDFEHLLWLAEWSRSGRPLGVVTGGSHWVTDLNAAHATGVAWLRELPTNPGRFRVAFWAYNPICGLTRDHPEFERIHATLAGAARTQERLWVATHSEETVEDQPDEQGLTAALPKIMDVRPI